MWRGRAVIAAILFVIAVTDARAQSGPAVVIVADRAIAPVPFGSAELQGALEARGISVALEAPSTGDAARPGAPTRIVVRIGRSGACPAQASSTLPAQGFAIRRVVRPQLPPVVCITGADEPGAMYALLELAERVRIGERIEQIADLQIAPRIARRGIKFNIPLDARTPSYSDDSTSAQGNIAEMWNMEFWTRFLDEMARHRYNLLSLWNLSPFPSLVKTPGYPGLALADVKRKTGALFDATNQGVGMFDPAWPLETLKTMTIDEKIAFWRAVMQRARDRGIAVSIITWNIFTHGTEGTAYGITDDPANPVTKDYFRRSVRALFNTYPLLASIGITSGEHMEPLDNAGKEDWLWETYGRGVADAIADARDLDFRWYPEASSSQSGFETVQQLVDGRYQPMTADEDAQQPLIMSVKAFVSGEPPAGRLTPLDVADRLARYAETGLARVAGWQPGTDAALDATIADIRAMAWLGRYYAEKTRGAVALARYQRERRPRDHEAARTHLTAASRAWREYAGIWSSRYLPQHLTRIGPRLIDIAAIQADVDKDIPAPLAPAGARMRP